MRTQARCAKASTAVHRPEDLARPAFLGDLQTDARTDGETVRLRTYQPQLDPVIAMAGVLEEHTPEFIGGIGAREGVGEVLPAVMGEVPPTHRDAPLPKTVTPRGRGVLQQHVSLDSRNRVRHHV